MSIGVGAHAALEQPAVDVVAEATGWDPEMLVGVGSIVVVVLLGIFLLSFIMSRFLYLCSPNEILVFSGRRSQLRDGSSVGFRVLHGGRRLMIPLFETVTRMDVRLLGVEVSVANAFSRGGIPLAVHAIANVKIATDPDRCRQAVERFLGVPPQQIRIVAQQTLEGVLREVLSQLTPEEVNEDRLKFANSLVDNAKDDFDKLGLELDVLKVQHVSDEQQYLRNLGRARIAHMLRDAQNAENNADQQVKQAQAAARQRAESAQQKAEAAILQKQNQFRAEIAAFEAEAKSIELEADVAAKTAQAKAEQELQSLRADLAKLMLHVDTVLPAEADAKARAARARADAAPTIENGRATAEALNLVAQAWTRAGKDGRELYVLQRLEDVITAAVMRVERMQIQSLQIVDGGDAESLSSVAGGFSQSVGRVIAETGRTLGVDLEKLVSGAEKGGEGR